MISKPTEQKSKFEKLSSLNKAKERRERSRKKIAYVESKYRTLGININILVIIISIKY